MDEYTVIGYNTHEAKHGLPLFKVFKKTTETTKDVQDIIASDQAMRYPHIIYMVVKTEDLWW